PSWRALHDAVGLPDLRVRPEEIEGDAWPEGGRRIWRAGRSVRMTDLDWRDGRLTIALRALPSPDDCDLALRVAEAAAGLGGAAPGEAQYLRRVGARARPPH